MKHATRLALLILLAPSLLAQNANVQINRENKTISVTSDHTLTVDPEIALVRVGFRNTSPQKEAVYRENVRVADAILKALKDAGIVDQQISTETLTLERQEQDDTRLVKPEMLQFEAFQNWTVRVAARDAQAVIELAAKAGANEISDPTWTVTDAVALEAQAYGAALVKARKIAEQMALGLGGQLGDLVYATNSANPLYSRGYNNLIASAAETSGGPIKRPEPVLKIFPKKVERRVQVVAVFNLK